MSKKGERISVEQPNGKRPRTEAVVRDEFMRALESKILRVLRGGRKLTLTQIQIGFSTASVVAMSIGVNLDNSVDSATFMAVWERVVNRITQEQMQERFTREVVEMLRGKVLSLTEIAARLCVDVTTSPITLEHNALLDTLAMLRFARTGDQIVEIAAPRSGRGEWRYYLTADAKKLEREGKLTEEYYPRPLEERIRG